MPFGTYEIPKSTPIPTFLQYLKLIGKGVEGKTKFHIEVIWLPGKFDNVTLQTHAFRYICDANHPLYDEVKGYCSNLLSRGTVPRLQIVISSVEARRIEVLEDPKIKVEWKSLGENAFKATQI